MKRVIFTAVALMSIIIPFRAGAAVGDIAGNVYSTDIKAYVDGFEIQSYCLEGKTAIPVEELREYVFEITYNNKERALFIKRDHIPETAPNFESGTSTLPVGTVVSHYYETDIQTYMDGYKVPAYALDGFTVIAIEDLTYFKYNFKHTYDSYTKGPYQELVYAMHRPFNDLGFYHIWDEENRTISLMCLRGGYVWTNKYGSFTAENSYIYDINYDYFMPTAIKGTIANEEKTYYWHLLEPHTAEELGIILNPVNALELHINTDERYSKPVFEKYFEPFTQNALQDRNIITPVMSKEIIINGTTYFAENMFTVVQNYLYVREDLFEVLEKFN